MDGGFGGPCLSVFPYFSLYLYPVPFVRFFLYLSLYLYPVPVSFCPPLFFPFHSAVLCIRCSCRLARLGLTDGGFGGPFLFFFAFRQRSLSSSQEIRG